MAIYKTSSYSSVQWICVMSSGFHSLFNLISFHFPPHNILWGGVDLIKEYMKSLLRSQLNRISYSNIEITQGNRMDNRFDIIKFNYPGSFRAILWLKSQRRSYLTIEINKVRLSKIDPKIHKKLLVNINQGKWPMKEEELNTQVKLYISKLQHEIAQIVTEQGVISLNLRKKLREVITSLPVRIIAIDELLKNPESKTPGIDNISLIPPAGDAKRTRRGWANAKNFTNIALYLLEEIKFTKLKEYRLDPIKCVNIKLEKSDGIIKVRSLKIPTLKDRAVQKLFTIVLDPAVDAISDPNSYGFRKCRNCHHAIGKIANILQKNPHNKIILNYNIKGFFDNICHDWIRKNFPMPSGFEHILDSWLKAKIFYNNLYTQNEFGVPKGGIISPLIVNFVLNGLEKSYNNNCINSIQIMDQKGKNQTFEITHNLIRYGNNFVVIINHNINYHHSPRGGREASPRAGPLELIKSNITNFLKERGLEINETNLKIVDFSLDRASFNFLGYTFARYNNVKKSSFNNRRDLKNNKIVIRPERSKVLMFKRKLKSIIDSNRNATAIALISELNPIIRGWENYYGLGLSAKVLAHIDNYVYRRITIWLKRKFSKTSIVRLNSIYFITQSCKLKKKFMDKKDENLRFPKSPYKRAWHFHAKDKQNQRTNIKFLTLAALIHKRVSCIIFSMNSNLLNISPYNNLKSYEDFAKKVYISRKRLIVN